MIGQAENISRKWRLRLSAELPQLYKLQLKPFWQELLREGPLFWLICFYLFLEYVRPQSIYPAINVLPWALVTVLSAVALSLHGGKLFKVSNAENSLFIMFFIVVVLSSIFAYYPQESFEKLDIYITWILVYFLITNIVTTTNRYFIFLVLYFLWNIKMTQHGFSVWVARGFSYDSWGVTGAPGWFQNSGEFGIQLCVYTPLLLYFIASLWKQWGWTVRFIALFAAISAMGSLVATNSRGAILGFIGATLWMILKSRRKAMAMAVITLISVIGYMVIPEQSLKRFDSAGEDYTSYTRLTRWKDAIEIMNNHPMLGIGSLNWMHYYREHYPPALGAEPWGLPHNIFLDAGAELGYTGLMLLVMMVIYTFVNNYRTRKLALQQNDCFSCQLAHGLDAGMVGLLISGSFVSVLTYPYFWIAMSFTVALNNVVRTNLMLNQCGNSADVKARLTR